MAELRDHYQTLGVAPGATAKELKAAYRALAKKMHPDVGGSAADLARVNEAADVLCDPQKRESYDRERKHAALESLRASSPAAAQAAPPPPKATVALCENCGKINRVKGDPRFYPAECGGCGQPLGTRTAPAAPATPEADMAIPPLHARCPHCSLKNRVLGQRAGEAITCLGCGQSFDVGTGDDGDSFGKFFGDLAGGLFQDPLGSASKGMKNVEGKLKDLADDLRRREEASRKKDSS